MISGVSFFYDPKLRDLWDQLTRTFGIDQVIEFETPEEVGLGPWTRAEDFSFSRRVFFSPEDSPTFPGTVSLEDFVHIPEAVYSFGSDYRHNDPVECEAVVYVPTPRISQPLWSVQVAALVFYDFWRKDGYR